MVGLEIVQQAALAAVRKNLVVDVQKDLGRQRLDLEAHLVVDAGGTGEGAVVFAPQPVVEQATFFRQVLVGGGHFGQENVVVLPANDVAGAGDADRQVVVLAA